MTIIMVAMMAMVTMVFPMLLMLVVSRVVVMMIVMVVVAVVALVPFMALLLLLLPQVFLHLEMFSSHCFLLFAVSVFTFCIICIICIIGHLYHCFDTAPHLPNCLGLGQPHPLPAKKGVWEKKTILPQKDIWSAPTPP